jgi:hypothetical protein
MLWSLPEELIHSLLSSWVGVEDFGRLDSAMCNKPSRLNFLRLVHAPGFVISRYCEPRIANRGRQLVNQFIEWVMRRDLAITELRFTPSFELNECGWTEYLQCHGNRITAITCEEGDDPTACCNVNLEAVLNALCKYCPNVSTLDLGMEPSAATCASIVHRWKQLTVLRMRVKAHNTDDGSWTHHIAICEACQALVELTLYGRPPGSVVTAMLQVCSPGLHSITMPVYLTAEDCKIIASRCLHLRELMIESGTVNDAALVTLAAGCPKLSNVPTSYDVTDMGILAIARNGALASLDLSFNRNVTDTAVLMVAANCSLLKSIDLSYCRLFTDAALIALAEGCPLLESVTLDLCTSLTDDVLIAVGQHCHNLRVLGISESKFTHIGLQAIALGCPLLEKLTASGSDDVRFAIAAIARGCPRLRSLQVARMEVPAETVRVLAQHCPLLEDADLYRNEEIGDEEITALVRGCPALTTLDIRYTAVRERGLYAVIQHCKRLRHIYLEEHMFPGGIFDAQFFPASVAVELDNDDNISL